MGIECVVIQTSIYEAETLVLCTEDQMREICERYKIQKADLISEIIFADEYPNPDGYDGFVCADSFKFISDEQFAEVESRFNRLLELKKTKA